MDHRTLESGSDGADSGASVVGGRLCWLANEDLWQCLSEARRRQVQRDCATCALYVRYARSKVAEVAVSPCGAG
ncbi:MAG: hypothetical protein LDL33_13355 [Desulfomonile sp.]|nr:hypothetical protein [Desulfomonile sp.]